MARGSALPIISHRYLVYHYAVFAAIVPIIKESCGVEAFIDPQAAIAESGKQGADSSEAVADSGTFVSDSIAPPAAAMEGAVSPPDTARTSKPDNREKIPSRSVWETVVSAPGWAAASPGIAFLAWVQGTTAFISTKEYGINIYHLLVSADGTRVIYPFYSSRYGLGIHYSKSGMISSASRLSLRGSYGWLQRASLWAQLERVRISPGYRPLQAGIFLGYTFFPDESLYGIGNESPKDAKTYYAGRELRLEPSFEKEFGPWFTVYALPAFDQCKISQSYNDDKPSTTTVYTQEELPGVGTTAFLGGARGAVRFDNRDSTLRTTKGMVAVGQGGFLTEIGGEGGRKHFGQWFAGGDYTVFLPMPWGPRRVLALRSVLEVRRNLPGKVIPFYLLGRLGGENSVRGLTRWRYYDNDVFTVSGAYGFPVWRFPDRKALLDGIFFLDAGQVARNIVTDFGFKRFHPGAGFGMHISTLKSSLVVLLVGFSGDGVHWYVSLG